MLSKIIIGTANFEKKYGILNKKIKIQDIKNICHYSIRKNIKYLDTASSYTNANKIIKKLNNKFEVITKILPSQEWKNPKYCLKKIENIKNYYDKKKINTIFFHDEKFLFKKYANEVYKNLIILKKKIF